MISSTLIIFIITLIVFYLIRKPHNYPPGPFRIPIFGYAFFIHPTKSHITFNALRAKYGDIVGLFLGPAPTVVVNGWEKLLKVFSNPDLNGRPHSDLVISTIDLPGEKGLIFVNGDFWKTQRRFALHHFRNLGFGRKDHQAVILEEAEELIDVLSKEKTPIDLQPYLGLTSINIIWAVTAGERYRHGDERLITLTTSISTAFRTGRVSGGLLAICPWLKYIIPGPVGYTTLAKAGRCVRGMVKEAIEEHKNTFDPAVTRDFIDIYLKELQSNDKDISFSEEQLAVACTDMMLGAAETTPSLISFCVLFMCLYPERQEELYEEMGNVLSDTGKTLPNLDDRSNLPKMEAFVHEILRYRTIAPLGIPHMAMRDTTLEEFRIPKGTTIFPNLRSVMMDKDYWIDPENFRPERFIQQDGSFKGNERVIPFGKGKRSCLGEPLAKMTGFLLVACLVARLKFSLPPNLPTPDDEGITGFTLGPPPFKVLVEPRTSVN